MIEDKPGRGESDEAGVIREKSLKEHDHSSRVISDEEDAAEKESELEEELPERGSDRKKKQPGRGSDAIEDQPGRGESRGTKVQRVQ